MAMPPGDRDEALFLQSQRFKSILESEGVMDNMRRLSELMDGDAENPGIPLRLKWIEERVQKLLRSNANLQKALYICTGFWLAVKVYLEFFHKP